MPLLRELLGKHQKQVLHKVLPNNTLEEMFTACLLWHCREIIVCIWTGRESYLLWLFWLGMTGDHLHGAQVGIVAVWKTTTTEDQSYIIQLFSNAGGHWRQYSIYVRSLRFSDDSSALNDLEQKSQRSQCKSTRKVTQEA